MNRDDAIKSDSNNNYAALISHRIFIYFLPFCFPFPLAAMPLLASQLYNYHHTHTHRLEYRQLYLAAGCAFLVDNVGLIIVFAAA